MSIPRGAYITYSDSVIDPQKSEGRSLADLDELSLDNDQNHRVATSDFPFEYARLRDSGAFFCYPPFRSALAATDGFQLSMNSDLSIT